MKSERSMSLTTPSFDSLCYVHIMVDTCSFFLYAVALSGEKASHVIKALKLTMLIMGLPWAIKTEKGSAYVT